MAKQSELLALAKLRQRTRYPGYKCIGDDDYHAGAYECDFVSPYTKTAGNIDAKIMVMLQDWASDEFLRGPFHEPSAKLGHSPNLPTNRNLIRLLKTTFGVTLPDVYGTNLFPFVKPGEMAGDIPDKDMVAAARQFGLPQIRIVSPKLVICLGLVTFNALRQVCDLSAIRPIESAIESPFDIGSIRVWCQAHTGARGQNNRNKGGVDRVSEDWRKMKADFGSSRGNRAFQQGGGLRAVQATHSETSKKIIKVPKRTLPVTLTQNKMNIFILNNKAFERRHREIYPLDDKLNGFAIYDYDDEQICRNSDLARIEPGDFALVFGMDRKVKEIFRVTGTKRAYAQDVGKNVFVIYGEHFGTLVQPMKYPDFIAMNELSCSRVDAKNNFTIGMLVTSCTNSQYKNLQELKTRWQPTPVTPRG